MSSPKVVFSPSTALAFLTFAAAAITSTPAAAIGACGDIATPIHSIQGAGAASPEISNVHEIEAVVVGDFQEGLRGFFLQERNGRVDGDPTTSEGMFVFYPGAIDVNPGDLVRVQGTVAEFSGLTELTSVTGLAICGTGQTVTTATLTLPVGAIDDLEALEGMAVTLPQTLYITEHFNFDRFGEIILATSRQFQPTATYQPGSPEQAGLAQANARSRIILDDGRTSQNPDPAIHPNGSVFDLGNLFRSGDSVQNVTGVLSYAFDEYRIQPTQGANYLSINPRPAQPAMVHGSFRVASFNLFNYFVTLGSRGASDASEFVRQRDKIFNAIATLDADIVGLIEIENHPADAALADLVSGLNAVAGAGTYAAVDTGPIGTDMIKVGIIYQPATVSPVGDFAILDASVDPAFLDDRNRPVLAQTFAQIGSGERFTVAVNHLKSKGSACDDVGDPDAGDGQEDCNLTRVRALAAEVAWLATDPTASGDPDVLIIGDLNSYDKEDPVATLIAAGYIDLLARDVGEFAYSYVFSGEYGYLDYAMANADLSAQITGTTVWHINSDEPDIIDYDTSFKQAPQDALYAPDAFRSSDHDPILIGLALSGDSDGDGVPDVDDQCPGSDLGATVLINSCSTGVPNQEVSAGCFIADQINACPAGNRGEFASCVAHLGNDLKRAGLISGKQKGRIQRCAN